MAFLRKLAAIIVMILSIIGFLLCLGGILGAWAVNEPATQGIVTALDTASQFLEVAENTSGVASQTVGDVSARLAEIQSAAADLSPDQQAALAARIEELVAPVQRVSSMALALEVGLSSLNDTLTTVSRLPGVRVEPPSAQMEAVGERLGKLGERLDALHATLSVVNPDGDRVAAITGETSSDLAAIESRLQQLNAQVAQAKQAAATVQAQTPRLLDLTSAGLTLLLTLLAAGQASLFVHAWGWFKD
jgi:DNA repair ATPase RecN